MTDKNTAIVDSFKSSIIDFVTQFNCYEPVENDWSQYADSNDIDKTWNNLLENVNHDEIIDYINTLDFEIVFDHWQQVEPDYLIMENVITEEEYEDMEMIDFEDSYETAMTEIINQLQN